MMTASASGPRPLTYDQMMQGEPCPSCGRPLLDSERWHFKGTAKFSESERKRYDAEQAIYSELHPDCGAGRWTMSGSLTAHCIACCPMPPLSPKQIEELGRLVTTHRARPKVVDERPARKLSRRMFNVGEEEWQQAREIAASRGEDLSAIVQRALKEYIEAFASISRGGSRTRTSTGQV